MDGSKSEFPTISLAELLERYPEIEDDTKHSYPWAAWMSSCQWDKVNHTLFILGDELRRIHISKRGVENLATNMDKSRIMIIWSETTNVWYPFRYDSSSTIGNRLYFKRVDEKCPIEYLILER